MRPRWGRITIFEMKIYKYKIPSGLKNKSTSRIFLQINIQIVFAAKSREERMLKNLEEVECL